MRYNPGVVISSVPMMIAVDLAIIGLVIVMLVAARRFGLFEAGRQPLTGTLLIIAAAIITALFYLADLVSMIILPGFIGMPRAMAFMQDLHLEIRWPVSLVSLILVGFGVVLSAHHRQRAEKLIREADKQIAESTERIIESEIRFRALVEQTPDAVYCLEFRPPVSIDLPVEEQIAHSYDAIIVECNEVFATSLEEDSPVNAIGIRLGELDSARHTESHTQLFRDFIASGYRLVDYELKYTTPAGEPRALQLSYSGVVKNGKLHRIWGAEKDILESSTTKSILASRLRFQRFVADLSSRLLVAPDEQARNVLEKCLARIGEYVRAERARLYRIDVDRDSEFNNLYWSKYGEPPFEKLPPERFPETYRRVQEGIPFAIADTRSLKEDYPLDAASFDVLGIKSIAIVPLTIAGKFFGIFLFNNIREHNDCSEQELIDLQLLCNLIASKVVQTEARRSLDAALAETQMAKSRLEAENVYLREEIRSSHSFDELIGESDNLMRCLRQVELVADTTTPVLLQGETGTGKELLALAIHKHSYRADRRMVSVNCAALPATLIESELFGYEKGAFTGALTSKAGRFESADGSTLFLDEIGDLPLELQSKLLRVLQSGEFERLGGDRTLQVDTRVIAATNLNLQQAVDQELFRADLYYRIAAFPITLPPLRERKSDIPLLAEHFVRKHAATLGKTIEAISSSMLDELRRYDWPGNVRELEGIVQRALISSSGPVLELEQPLQSNQLAPAQPTVESFVQFTDLRTVEREHITRVLEQTDWVVGGRTGAATLLGLPASTLRSKMKKLGIGRAH